MDGLRVLLVLRCCAAPVPVCCAVLFVAAYSVIEVHRGVLQVLQVMGLE